MAVRHDQPKKRIRVVRSKNQLTRDYVEECRLLQQRILARRGGVPLPDGSELIQMTREERDMRNIGQDK